MTDHLRPTAAIAPLAVLPGDPGRALALAQDLLEGPRMANHARGLWGYTALTPGGDALTVQSTGIGGPSVAIVLTELHSLGVRRAVRIGTCTALDPSVEAGELVVAQSAIPPGGGETLMPDASLTAALAAAEPRLRGVTVAGADRYYDPDETALREARLAAGGHVVDLGTAATLEVGARLGVEVASVLVVARDASLRLDDEAVERLSLELGRAASASLLA
jgi:uridine phosphorylase